MKKGKYRKFGKDKKLRGLLLCGVLAVGLILFFLYDFQVQTSFAVAHRARVQLQEITEQVSASVYLELEHSVDEVNLMAIVLGEITQPMDEAIEPILAEAVKSCGLSRLAVVTAEGQAYSSTYRETEAGDYRFHKVALSGQAGVSEVFVSGYKGQRVISIYAPIYRNSQVAGVVLGTIVMDDIKSVLSFSGFGGAGYSYLMQSDGEIVVLTDHQNTISMQSSFFGFLDEKADKSTLSGEEMHQMVQAGQAGYVQYEADGMKRLAYFMPAGFKDWFVISVVPQDVLNAYNLKMSGYAVQLIIKTLLVVLAMAVLVARWTHANQRNLRRAHAQAIGSNIKYQLAILHTRNEVFEYDLEGDYLFNLSARLQEKLSVTTQEGRMRGKEARVLLTPQSQTQAMDMVYRALQIEEAVTDDLEMQDGRWLRVSLSGLDQEGRPCVVGTLEEVTSQKKIEAQYIQEEKYCRDLLVKSMSGFSVNIEDGSVSDFYLLGEKQTGENGFTTLDATMLDYISGLVHPDYQKEIRKLHGLDSLRWVHGRGIREITEYFMVKITPESEYTWVMDTIHFLPNLATGHPMVFSGINKVSEEKVWELEMEYYSERDGLTGLYNRITFVRRVNAALQQREEAGTSALLMLDLDGFKGINDDFGHQAGDRLLCCVARILENTVGPEHYIGRLGGDEFVVFLYGQIGREDVLQIAEKVCQNVEQMSRNNFSENRVTASVGVAFCHANDSFDDVYPRADQMMYQAKKEGKNRVQVLEGEG